MDTIITKDDVDASWGDDGMFRALYVFVYAVKSRIAIYIYKKIQKCEPDDHAAAIAAAVANELYCEPATQVEHTKFANVNAAEISNVIFELKADYMIKKILTDTARIHCVLSFSQSKGSLESINKMNANGVHSMESMLDYLKCKVENDGITALTDGENDNCFGLNLNEIELCAAPINKLREHGLLIPGGDAADPAKFVKDAQLFCAYVDNL